MKQNENISFYGETRLIELIDEVIYGKTGKRLRRDDSFFLNVNTKKKENVLFLTQTCLTLQLTLQNK